MKKYKTIILFAQMFCLLVLLLSAYLDSALVQLAYCFTVFSVPFLVISFAEVVLFSEKVKHFDAATLVAELLIAVLFLEAAVKGMQMGGAAARGFSTLLLFFIISCVFATVERLALQAE